MTNGAPESRDCNQRRPESERIARRLASGVNVVIASRKLDRLEETAKEFSSLPGKTVPVCHVGRAAELSLVRKQRSNRTGHFLVNSSATNIGQGPALGVTSAALLKRYGGVLGAAPGR
jgi:hypothetical protein